MINKNTFGIIGIFIAIIAITVAVFQDELRPSPPPVSEQLTTRVLEKGVELLVGDVEKKNKRDLVGYTYAGLGLLALMLGVFSFTKKENTRISGLAGALGILAIAWEYVLIGIVIAVVIIIFAEYDPL